VGGRPRVRGAAVGFESFWNLEAGRQALRYGGKLRQT
jgi:hypothetical protein